jgi:chromosome segregation ATPase
MIAEVERAEKELDFAQRKLKQLEDLYRKTKTENEQLKQAKRGLTEDLEKLLNKRQEIEHLQTTLMSIIQHSHGKKINVDELRSKLASSVRKDKGISQTIGGYSTADTSKKTKRVKSPVSPGGDDFGRAVEGEDGPAWYKALKKNLQ